MLISTDLVTKYNLLREDLTFAAKKVSLHCKYLLCAYGNADTAYTLKAAIHVISENKHIC